MFELKICGYEELQEVIALWQPTHVLSVLNGMKRLPDPDIKHLFIEVSDVPMPIEGHIHPIREHLEQMFAFTAELTDADRLLVHCYAGMSRSTATAIGVCIQHGMPYDLAFQHVALIRPILVPNQMFIQLIDEYFDLQGDLIRMVVDYRHSEMIRMFPPDGILSPASIASMKELLTRLQ